MSAQRRLAAFTRALERGGIDAATKWARRNPTAFYNLAADCFPEHFQPEDDADGR